MTKIEALDLKPGDMVQILAKSVPTEFPAAVVSVSPEKLEIISTVLSVLTAGRRGGDFPDDDIICIEKTEEASVAIPREARRTSFNQGVKLQAQDRQGVLHTGKLHCAFDGVISIRLADGRLFTGGASHFNLVT